jgi:hypothetical protein
MLLVWVAILTRLRSFQIISDIFDEMIYLYF